MQTVNKFYKALNISEAEYGLIVEKLGREPNDLETYLFSAMWSEHCGYKHSKKYLRRFPKAGSILSDENAGGVQIGNHVLFFKVESHNHPSAVEPFQGAATGIGGIIRDVLALGARPIALLDSLKFGKLDNSKTKHLFEGVVDGISSYGNSIGVPTIAGEVAFDESYMDSPLVNVMAVGIVHKDKIKTSGAVPGNRIVLVGSHTGRDGIHGASFASKELNENSKDDRPSVQIGDPFIKKILIEATLEILTLDEVVSCQDCGAAGLLSSTSEMTYKGECGIDLYLDRVHQREPGMQPWEIMLSESQERMVFVVQQPGLDKVLNIAKKYNIPASVIGETNQTGLYRLLWEGETRAELMPEHLCNCPEINIDHSIPEYIHEFQSKTNSYETLIPEAVKRLIGDPNFASKKWVFSQYDHTVGNRTVIKPGMSGASALWIYEENGVAGFTIDSNPVQVFLDPFNGSKNTVYECFRNLVSCGFDPLGITDCLNYGNPEKNEVAYQLVGSIDGISSACTELKIPVVSGNVSLYNESPDYRVFPTPTIGMTGYTDSCNKIISNSFSEGETVYLLGKDIENTSNVGGSLYHRIMYNFVGGYVDEVDPILEAELKKAIFILRDTGFLSACVDVSEGGILGALFEGLYHNRIGFSGSLISCDDKEKALFGEITGRYLITSKNKEETEKLLDGLKVPYRELGMCAGNSLSFNGYSFEGEELFNLYENSIQKELER